MGRVLAWFHNATAAAEDAGREVELAFSSALAKHHRAQVHAAAEALGHGSREQKHKAGWLRTWAAEAGVASLSHDEAVQMVATNALPPQLADLWACKSAEQRSVGVLIAAASRGDLPGLQAALAEAGEAVRLGVYDVDTRRGPLHAAAGAGQVAALEALLVAGAPVDGLDGNKLTALQVARKWEQCDAEGALLRAGAADPEAHRPLGPPAETDRPQWVTDLCPERWGCVHYLGAACAVGGAVVLVFQLSRSRKASNSLR
ncbi:hypothetical protein WJX81_005401 [Elliptochloris bilobata]|uniref:Uncharacterized protein n=1 Tax=Elliptochloris bilobata TaxID=381761 RepID=A0AAW1QNI2_9CHLO